MNKTLTTKIEDIKNLINEGKKQEAHELFKFLTEEELSALSEGKEYQNINGHKYTGWNLFFLTMTREPGTFGTFAQWIKLKKCVIKGQAGIALLAPIFKKENKDGKEKETLAFFTTITVFREDQVGELKTKEEREIEKKEKEIKERSEGEKLALEII